MSLPPGFLAEITTRVPLSSVVGRKVTWDMRKSHQARGDWWAPCPFHQEKTASFHVDDRKGFYYCFGCQAKGDAITFLRETANLSFREAVAALAAEAGLEMPAADPAEAARSERRKTLFDVLEVAARFYRMQLSTAAATPARSYLAEARGLAPEALERWGIGWAPEDSGALVAALGAKGIDSALALAAGALARGDSGRLYDRFRGRITFPIRDARGRIISFGGRSLDPGARAKYLNGAESEIFDKGRTLFNLDRARAAAGRGRPLIVAEGYMDVIALSEAGFAPVLAPLGTAITEEQLQLMWRIDDEPVIALDGDAAGLRAALRLAHMALPLLQAGKGLRFALLPDGNDPDDLIRAGGAAAMRRVIEAAQPMVAILWQSETEGRVFDSPERRAALEQALHAMVGRIRDATLRGHYAQVLRERQRALFRPAPPAAGRASRPGRRAGPRMTAEPAPPAEATRRSLLAAGGTGMNDPREAVILALLAHYPALARRFEAALERMEPAGTDHARLRDLILAHAGSDDCLARIGAEGPDALAQLMAHPHVRHCPALGPHAGEDQAAAIVEEALGRLASERAHRVELAEARAALEGAADENLTWRIARTGEAVHQALRGIEDAGGEITIARNGVRLDRDEVEGLQQAFDSIDFSRGASRRH